MRDHRTISIADQIFEKLEKDILSGKYNRGDIISEVKLSEELNVSRTPIREAIRRLEQERIVEEGDKGLQIVGISRDDMHDMYEIRLKLEGEAAARAARNITEDQLKEMKDTLDLQLFYIDKDSDPKMNADDIKEMDSKFHRQIYAACGSKAYFETLMSLHMKMLKFRKASVSKRSRARLSYDEHVAIYEALKAHDEAEASKYMIQHIQNARDSIDSMPDSVFS